MWPTLLLLYVVFDALADAIDHGKGSLRLKGLWHLVKRTGMVLLFLAGVFYEPVPWYAWALLLAGSWVVWQFLYQLGRLYGVWRWDEKLDFGKLNKLWKRQKWL